jgi:O-antigen/teichoic acid export membrane protein
LSLFGSGFGQRGAITVVVLMVAMLVSTYAGPADTLLLMSGRSLASLINSLVALSLDLGLCFLLIPSFGIAGAAAGWASSLVARNMLAYALVYRSLKLSPASLASTIAAAAGVVCFGIPMLIIWKTGNDDLMTFIVVASIGALCYAGILWLARKPLRLRVLRGIARRRLPATITE